MSRHAAPRRRRDDVDRALSRVTAVLPPQAPGGWCLPPEPTVADLPPAPLDPQPAPVPVPPEPAPSRGVLAELRTARLDLARPGALGLGLVALVCCLLAVVVVQRGRPEPVAAAAPVVEQPGAPVEGGTAAEAPSPAAAEVVVAVSGDVVRPGLVRLPTGSRVADAVQAAGGLSPGADPGALNLARVLVDGEQVLVGAALAAAPPAPGAAPGAAPGPLDLNAAAAGDLDALPGIGPVLAERIVAWRTEHGPFRSVEQLREVEGIGPAKYDSLRDLVRV